MGEKAQSIIISKQSEWPPFKRSTVANASEADRAYATILPTDQQRDDASCCQLPLTFTYLHVILRPFHSLSECEAGVDTTLDPSTILIMEMIAKKCLI